MSDNKRRAVFLGLDENELVGLLLVTIVVIAATVFWWRGRDAGTADRPTGAIAAESAAAARLDGRLTSDGRLTLSGTAAPGSRVEILQNDAVIDRVTADASSGVWRYERRFETPGDYALAARVQNTDGRVVRTAPYRFTIAPDGAAAVLPVEQEATSADGTSPGAGAEGAAGRSTAEPGDSVADGGAAAETPETTAETGPDAMPPTEATAQAEASAAAEAAAAAEATAAAAYPPPAAETPDAVVAAPAPPAAGEAGYPAPGSSATPAAAGGEPAAGEAAAAYPQPPGSAAATEGAAAEAATAEAAAAEAAATEAAATEAAATEAAATEAAPAGEATGTAAIPRPEPNVVETLRNRGQFNTLLAALERAGLTGTLQGNTPITLFAPTDAAFAALPQGAVAAYLEQPFELTNLLLQHVAVGKYDAAAVAAQGAVGNLAGRPLTVGRDPVTGAMTVNGAPIAEADLQAGNGTVHALDALILPPANTPPPAIDASGVPTFRGTFLTVVGTATPGTTLALMQDAREFGRATVAADGSWLIAGDIAPGFYRLVAYTLSETGLVRAASAPVYLNVE